jgi:hypothetical protein
MLPVTCHYFQDLTRTSRIRVRVSATTDNKKELRVEPNFQRGPDP